MRIIRKLQVFAIFLCLGFIFTACSKDTMGEKEEPALYSVTYDSNGALDGDVPVDTGNYEKGATVIVRGNIGSLINSGYSFSGWNTNANGSGITYTEGQTFTIGENDLTLYARWIISPTYIVTYDDNGATGGSVPVDSTNYETGMSVIVKGNTGNLINTGYTFAGWNTKANGSGTPFTEGQIFSMGTANVTLYANWTANPTYTVTYNSNGATGGSLPIDSTNYKTGMSVIVKGNTGNLTRTGYAFVGWSTQSDGNGTIYTQSQTFNMGDSNVTLYAKWNLTYAVTYNGNGSTGGTVPSDPSRYQQGQIVTVRGNSGNLYIAHYTFTGWNTQVDGLGTNYTQGQTFTMGSGNFTLYANWTQNPTYTVTYDGNGNTSGTVPVDTHNYFTNDIIGIIGNTGNLVKDGFAYAGWNSQADGNGFDYLFYNNYYIGTANITIYAKWGTPYTVTYNDNGSTSGTVPIDSKIYAAGQYVGVLGNLGNLVKDGYSFAGWTLQPNTGITYISGFNIGAANVTLYAKWNPSFSADGVIFNMVFVPNKTFYKGYFDNVEDTIEYPFLIGETEVTFELWNIVHTWAISNGYHFSNSGTIGSSGAGTYQQPVTTINWRDALVWTNAATEWYNSKNSTTYTCAYTYSSNIIRDSRDSNATACDNAVVNSSATGFRLPTSSEWELAARYIADANNDGDICEIGEYYPYNFVSGSSYDVSVYPGLYAWFSSNSSDYTHEVKTKYPNALGIYDMSGNVSEFCYEWDPDYVGQYRVVRGGAYLNAASGIIITYEYRTYPYDEHFSRGFRIVKSQ
jgi:uncharacterized repeat protein (TIGR02543 family)